MYVGVCGWVWVGVGGCGRVCAHLDKFLCTKVPKCAHVGTCECGCGCGCRCWWVWVWAWVWVWVRVCTYVYKCTYTGVHKCACISVHKCAQVFIGVHICVHIYAHMCTYVHKCASTSVANSPCSCLRTYVRTYMLLPFYSKGGGVTLGRRTAHSRRNTG